MGRAALRASLAPSVHNTQPWRFAVTRGSFKLYADDTRRLRVLDPRGRQLLISCGCALFNARAALAAAGYEARVERLPDPERPELVARLTLPAEVSGWVPIGALDAAVEQRRTNRRRFFDDPVPEQVVQELVAAAQTEGAELFPITRPEHRLAVSRLSRQANALEIADPRYRAELHAWTTTDPHRSDGVLATTVPRTDPVLAATEDLPLRGFDPSGKGWLPSDTRSSMNQCLLLLGTLDDGPAPWLRAGEALERVWLELTRRGYVASPLTQVVEVARTHRQLNHELQLRMYPHVLLRVGRAPSTPASRRRPLHEVLVETR